MLTLIPQRITEAIPTVIRPHILFFFPASSGTAAKRAVQAARFADKKGVYCNAQMDSSMLHQYAKAEPAAIRMLGEAMNRLNLSARAYDRILKVSRTIADMDLSDTIRPDHIAEAIGYRSLDRASWGK